MKLFSDSLLGALIQATTSGGGKLTIMEGVKAIALLEGVDIQAHVFLHLDSSSGGVSEEYNDPQKLDHELRWIRVSSTNLWRNRNDSETSATH